VRRFPYPTEAGEENPRARAPGHPPAVADAVAARPQMTREMDMAARIAQYYRTEYPADAVHALVALHTDGRPENSEVSLTARKRDGGGEYWARANALPTPQSLRQLLARPAATAVHLGAHYDRLASQASQPGTEVRGKPFVFDIDLQDSLQIDKGDQAANDRWVRLVFAQVYVLKAALEEVYGFEHFLAVYSGRRGCHLWVLDERAFRLDDEARSAVCAQLSAPLDKRDPSLRNHFPVKGDPSFGATTWKAFSRALHKVLKKPFFAGGVGLFDDHQDVERIIDRLFTVPNEDGKWAAATAEVRATAKQTVGRKRGPEVLALLENAVKDSKFFSERLRQLVFSYLWPALDVGASAKRTHPTKLPFSTHASTARIALPMADLLGQSGTTNYPPRIRPHDMDVDPAAREAFASAVAQARDALQAAVPVVAAAGNAKRARCAHGCAATGAASGCASTGATDDVTMVDIEDIGSTS
jgi:DNA primase catalytic subunit